MLLLTSRGEGVTFSGIRQEQLLALTEITLAAPAASQSDALRGTIDLLVLKTLTLCAMHGWGIGQRIQQITGGDLEVNQGSLYPALQRLEHKGWIASEWGPSENNRRARYYRLTAAGRRA